MYYSAAVVGLNTSAFLEAACVGKPVHTVLLPEISIAQPGRHDPLPLPADRQRRAAARRAQPRRARCALLADSLAGDGGGDPKAAAFADGFIRPFGLDQAATPRFVEALERWWRSRRRAAARRRSRRVLLAAPARRSSPAVLALNVRTQLWRKHTRNRRAEGLPRDAAPRAHRPEAVRGRARSASGRATSTDQPSSALTPKLGRPRDPAKKLAGWDIEEAREIRELVTLLGRSGRPIVLGPWLSETGFELLYWIPFLAWAKTYGNFDPEQLVVVSRGGARAVVLAHHVATTRTCCQLLHARRVPRSATTSASSRSAAG